MKHYTSNYNADIDASASLVCDAHTIVPVFEILLKHNRADSIMQVALLAHLHVKTNSAVVTALDDVPS